MFLQSKCFLCLLAFSFYLNVGCSVTFCFDFTFILNHKKVASGECAADKMNLTLKRTKQLV